MSGCDQQVVDPGHDSIWMMPCGEPVVRGGKCEQHKVDRREFGDRRQYGSSDSPPTCGNSLCHVEHGATRHHTMCPDYGPGWA